MSFVFIFTKFYIKNMTKRVSQILTNVLHIFIYMK